jgi:hypothetical protein
VGIVVGRQDVPGWSGIVLMAAAWSVGMYVMGAFVVDAAIRALPQSSRVVYTVRLERPQSHAYHVVTIQGGDVCRMDSGTVVVPKRILTVMSLAGRNSTLDLDVPAGVYAYAGVDGKKVQVNGVFDTKAALDWMKAAGIDTTLPGVEAEAVEIVERAVAVPPPYQGTSHFSTHTTGQSAGFLGIDMNWDGTPVESKGKSAMAGGSLFLIWIGGLWFIVRRYAPRR